MDLLRIADQVSDPTQITAKTVAALQAALGAAAAQIAVDTASLTSSTPSRKKGRARNTTKLLETVSAPSSTHDPAILTGALRILKACSSAMGIISEKGRSSQSPLGSTWVRRRGYVVQMAQMTLAAIPPVTSPDTLFSAEKKLCNIASLAVEAQVPMDGCLELAQTLKSRVETIGIYHEWLVPSPADSPMVLVPNTKCTKPDPTLVQLASMSLLRTLLAHIASGDPRPAIDHLNDAIQSNTKGHVGWWLSQLESIHGPQVSRPQYLFAARQLARAQPPPTLVPTVVDWLVNGNAALSDMQIIVNRLPPPVPLASGLAHLARHPLIANGCPELVSIAALWAISPAAQGSSVPQTANDLASACDWLRVHATKLPMSHPDTWTIHLAVLLLQATKATSSCIPQRASLSSQAVKSLELLLPHLRSRPDPNQFPLTKTHVTITLRAGDRFVQAARQLTDKLDPDNPFAPKDQWAVALVHDCVSQLVAHLFPYLAESRTAARTLVEWLMYIAQLMVTAKETGKVERSLITAVKVCLHGAPPSNGDDPSQSLTACLKRISTVAAKCASSARGRKDNVGALGLAKVAATALEALLSRAPDYRAALEPSLAYRFEMMASLTAEMGHRKDSHTFMRRALALTLSHGSLPDIWHMTSRYVSQALSALLACAGTEGDDELPSSASMDSLADSATADLSSHADNDAEKPEEDFRSVTAKQPPAKYTRLSSMVADHWVFFFEWRALVSVGHLQLAAAVLDAWDAATPPHRLIARGHVALCKASQAAEAGGAEYAETAVELLKTALADPGVTDMSNYCTELLATAYCFLAFLQNHLPHLATAFTLFKNAKNQDRLPLIRDTLWHLRTIEAVLLSHCQYHLLIQLYEVQLLLEKDSARGDVFVRLAEAYLDLDYVGQAGHCLSTGAAYLAPHERSRWNPVYTMYLLAAGNPAKAATFLDGVTAATATSKQLSRSAILFTRGPKPSDGDMVALSSPSESAVTQLLSRMARVQLLHAQGKGPAALEAALQSLSAAAKVPSPAYQLRLLSVIARLFSDLGIWSDAESHARKGLRWSTRGKNMAMQTHFASISAAIALRRRAIDDARAALAANPAVSHQTSPEPVLRRASSIPFPTSSPSHLSSGIPRPSTPVSGASPSRPSSAQDAPINALVSKENVSRLVLLGEASLLELASETQSASNRISKLRPVAANLDDASAHELRARLLLDNLKKPRLVAELFHSNNDSSLSTPRIQRILMSTAETAVGLSNPSSEKLQRMAMISLDAQVSRLRAAVLTAQGKTSDAANLLIQQVREFTAPLGFARAQFVHDAASTILSSLEPHLTRIPAAAAVKSAVTVHHQSPIQGQVPDMDNRVVRRLKFVFDLLMDSVDALVDTAHPALLHGIGYMIMYIQDLAQALGLPEFTNVDRPLYRLADMLCHGVALKRLVTLFGPKQVHRLVSSVSDKGSRLSSSLLRQQRHAASPPRSFNGASSNNLLGLRTPSPQPVKHRGNTALATPTPTTPPRRSRKSRPTPRTDGPLEEEMLCLMLDDGVSADSDVVDCPSNTIHLGGLLPAKWTFCQLGIDPVRNIMTLFVCTSADHVTLRIPLARRELRHRLPSNKRAAVAYSNVRSTLDTIVQESDSMLRGTYETRDDKLKWWDTRERLDRELESVVMTLDGVWLGCFRGMLVAGEQPLRIDFMRRLNDFLAPCRKGPSAPRELQLPPLVVNGWLALGRTITDVDVEDITSFVLNECIRQSYPVASSNGVESKHAEGIAFDSLALFVAKTFKSLLSTAALDSVVVQEHTVLALDKHAHPFPWESTASLAGKSVSRVFSLAMLKDLLLAGRRRTVNKDSLYYCINPGGDLTGTQDRFDQMIRGNASWRGTVGSAPPQSQFLSQFSSHDVFLYIGHNGGEQLCPPKRILSHHSGPAVALLLGCSSGKLSAPGDFDPIGTPMYYSPHSLCVVGNLWDVTDRDIDRFTVAMLANWGLIPSDFAIPVGDTDVVPKSERKSGQEVPRNMAPDLSQMRHRQLPLTVSQPTPRRRVTEGGRGAQSSVRVTAIGVDLAKAVAEARSVCKLRYLNGAAPVVYGVPVHLAP